ncbi:MAG: hypothetical protein FK731_10035 [Asgard group archaeon]|nr:hypothetical protein [Asgard group archaeon]
MTIKFRNLNAEEELILKENLCYWLNEEKANDFIKKNFFLIAEGKWKEIFIITKKIQEFLHKNDFITPYSVGLGFGEFKDQMIYLTLSGASFIAKITNKKAVISIDGEQPFLYQKHILAKSVISCSRNCNINEKIIVINQFEDFLGIGQLKIEVNEIKNEKLADQIAIYNLMDLGWYLRKGR